MRGLAGLLTTTPDAPRALERLLSMLGRDEPDARVVGDRVSVGASDRTDAAASADGRVRAFLDGALANAAELRRELAASGHRFDTDGAAEVVLRGYEQWGAAGVA